LGFALVGGGATRGPPRGGGCPPGLGALTGGGAFGTARGLGGPRGGGLKTLGFGLPGAAAVIGFYTGALVDGFRLPLGFSFGGSLVDPLLPDDDRCLLPFSALRIVFTMSVFLDFRKSFFMSATD